MYFKVLYTIEYNVQDYSIGFFVVRRRAVMSLPAVGAVRFSHVAQWLTITAFTQACEASQPRSARVTGTLFGCVHTVARKRVRARYTQ